LDLKRLHLVCPSGPTTVGKKKGASLGFSTTDVGLFLALIMSK